MKKIELFISLFMLLFVIMNFLNIACCGLLLGVSLFFLSGFYYFLSFAFFNEISLDRIFEKSSYKNISAFKIIFAIGVGWTFSITILGALFKLELLPYAQYILLVGLIAIGITSVISLIFTFQTKSNYYKQILIREIIIGGIGLILFITN